MPSHHPSAYTSKHIEGMRPRRHQPLAPPTPTTGATNRCPPDGHTEGVARESTYLVQSCLNHLALHSGAGHVTYWCRSICAQSRVHKRCKSTLGSSWMPREKDAARWFRLAARARLWLRLNSAPRTPAATNTATAAALGMAVVVQSSAGRGGSAESQRRVSVPVKQCTLVEEKALALSS